MYMEFRLELFLMLAFACSIMLAFGIQLQLRKNEKKRKEAEERGEYYHSLFERHRNAIIEVDLNGTITGLNPYAARLVEEAGVPCIGEPLLAFAFPEYKAEVSEAFARASAGETSVIDQLSIFLSPEHTHWHATYSPAYRSGTISGVFVTAVDCTDKHNLQLELQRKRLAYDQAAESIMDIVLVLDRRMVPLYASPSFEKRLGYRRGDYLFEIPVTEYVDDEANDRIRKEFERLSEGMSVSGFELKFPRSDGRMIDLDCNATPQFDEAGELDRIIVVLRDITLRKNAEQALLDGEKMYLKLQHSLDAFSEEALYMMKAAELEQRLLAELRNILRPARVAVLETTGFRHFACRQGDRPEEEQLERLRDFRGIRLPVGQVFELDSSAFIMIGDHRGMTQLVWLEGCSDELAKKPIRVWLQTLSRYTDSFYENMLKLKDLTHELESLSQRHRTPAWLLRLMYAVSEKERRRLSQDLHDAALQEQIIWYRKLEMLQHSRAVEEKTQTEIGRICEGLLDVIHQIRMTCHELRPPFLKEWGIGQALEALYDQTQMRADYRIAFDSSGFTAKLEDEQMIALYRINQELLNNAIKHSEASEVRLSLTDHADGVLMTYQDNGVGIPETKLQNLLSSMGLYGIKERVRSLEGDVQIESAAGEGLSIHVYLPKIHAAAIPAAV
ncbi:hypothetical protein CDO73_02390 [Saccharibacillus sp. O23]|uniref:PAS domain-containing sensor histidine kinase n=1 Tax=Saccharibacillus sp. O23 TaxID=2009338 RepID=UPI000B4E025C|nr:PAS domain-containing protein [Saccharibacillus sp. O23]OWR32474.1 hypothetical protein CDO73_02390 [Saccharibacillus sp. O23]